MTIEQIKTIGIEIPITEECIEECIKYCTKHCKNFKEFGLGNLFSSKKVVYKTLVIKDEELVIKDEECIFVECLGYKGDNYYIVPISELIRIGIVEPEFVLPERWWVRVTKENIDVLKQWRFNNTISRLEIGWVVTMAYNGHGVNKEHNDEPYTDNYDFGVEITYEQFLKYVLKQEAMNITGYKVLKLVPLTTFKIGQIIPKDSGVFQDCKNFPEFFEPIYEEEYKIGDWVISIGKNHTYDNDNFPINIPWKILEFKSSKGIKNYHVHVDKSSTNIKGICTDINSIRKATEEEIKAAETVEINGYNADYSKGEYVKFGCKQFTKTEIESYLSLLNYDIDAKITIGSTQITSEILKKILSKLN